MALPTMTGVGRMIEDPELRFTPSGMAIAKLRLAFNDRRLNKDTNEWEDGDSYFVDGTVFKEVAEHVAESLTKGMEVCVSGRLKTRKYETKEGEKRSVVELVIDSIGPSLKFATATVTKAGKSGGGSSTGQARPAARQQASFDDTPPF